jgi:hypothetical protein
MNLLPKNVLVQNERAFQAPLIRMGKMISNKEITDRIQAANDQLNSYFRRNEVLPQNARVSGAAYASVVYSSDSFYSKYSELWRSGLPTDFKWNSDVMPGLMNDVAAFEQEVSAYGAQVKQAEADYLSKSKLLIHSHGNTPPQASPAAPSKTTTTSILEWGFGLALVGAIVAVIIVTSRSTTEAP